METVNWRLVVVYPILSAMDLNDLLESGSPAADFEVAESYSQAGLSQQYSQRYSQQYSPSPPWDNNEDLQAGQVGDSFSRLRDGRNVSSQPYTTTRHIPHVDLTRETIPATQEPQAKVTQGRSMTLSHTPFKSRFSGRSLDSLPSFSTSRFASRSPQESREPLPSQRRRESATPTTAARKRKKPVANKAPDSNVSWTLELRCRMARLARQAFDQGLFAVDSTGKKGASSQQDVFEDMIPVLQPLARGELTWRKLKQRWRAEKMAWRTIKWLLDLSGGGVGYNNETGCIEAIQERWDDYFLRYKMPRSMQFEPYCLPKADYWDNLAHVFHDEQATGQYIKEAQVFLAQKRNSGKKILEQALESFGAEESADDSGEDGEDLLQT